MVMLHKVCNSHKYTKDELIVAHFDHGIRENSAEDAEFVQRKAGEYGLECRIGHGELGAETSEAEARRARYAFLKGIIEDIWREQGGWGEIWTAHHLDDLVESVAINFIRGTGWRGLAALNRKDVRRPLLDLDMVSEPMDKRAIFRYAATEGLEYREDPSNSWDEYLRNRIRHQMNKDGEFDYEKKLELYRLWQKQKLLKTEAERVIEWMTDWFAPSGDDAVWERNWFREMDETVALEILRQATQNVGISATRPQLKDFREAILSYAPGKYFNLPDDKLVKIGKDSFRL